MALKTDPAPVNPPADCNAVKSYDWDIQIAYAVCMAESRGNPKATNLSNFDGSIDRGLMQINSIHADMVAGDLNKLYDPATNLDIAYKLYKARGFKPWVAYTSGKYKEFM